MLDSPEILLRKPIQHPDKVKTHIKNIKGLDKGIENKTAEQIARNLTARDLWLKHETDRVEKYKSQSIVDPLTQLYNRRHLDGDDSDTVLGIGELRREFDDALRSNHDLSILMIDIDNFKEYNDTYGHPEGDRALKTIADAIRQAIRDTDIPFRYGGEELLVLLPEANLINAAKTAEKLREAIKKVQTLKRKVTVSIGVSTFHNSEEWRDKIFNQSVETKDQLLQLADDALYFSKKQGRDRITTGNNLTEKQILEKHPQEDK